MEKIVLLFENRENAKLLMNFFSGMYHTECISDAGDLSREFDLCIIDGISFENCSEIISKKKKKEEPYFLPFLIVTGKTDPDLISKGAWKNTDGVIVSPVIKADLLARASVLIKTRSLSKQLHKKVDDLTAFANNIAHDISRPLRITGSYIDSLSAKLADSPERDIADLVNRIREQNQVMNRLIANLLRFAKTGLTETRFRKIDIHNLINSSLNELRELMPGKKIELERLNTFNITGDAALVKQAILNILHNSAKYSLPDQVLKLRVSRQKEESFVVLTLSDNGIGFNVPVDENLFRVYSRHGRTDFAEGEGIGLSIVKLIMEKHFGKVKISSIEGEGTTVSLYFPDEVSDERKD